MSNPLDLTELDLLEHYILKLHNQCKALEGLPAYHKAKPDLAFALRGIRDGINASYREVNRLAKELNNE